MPVIDTPSLSRLARYLDLTAARQALIASNLANLDTPGYRTRDVNFRAELSRVFQPGGLPLAPTARPVAGLLQRPDGNNVSADRESLLMAETQLRFRSAIELVRAEFRRLLAAINEGK
jgi:flagellar basal-body rod protein FlgB